MYSAPTVKYTVKKLHCTVNLEHYVAINRTMSTVSRVYMFYSVLYIRYSVHIIQCVTGEFSGNA